MDGSGSGPCRQVREAVLGDQGTEDANPSIAGCLGLDVNQSQDFLPLSRGQDALRQPCLGSVPGLCRGPPLPTVKESERSGLSKGLSHDAVTDLAAPRPGVEV